MVADPGILGFIGPSVGSTAAARSKRSISSHHRRRGRFLTVATDKVSSSQADIGKPQSKSFVNGQDRIEDTGEETQTTLLQDILRRLNIFRKTEYDGEILRMALPSYGSMLMDPLASLVDTLFVGRLGVLPLAGVGVANSLFCYFSWMFFFLVATTTSEVAIAKATKSGTEQSEGISKTVGGALWIAFAIGFLSMFFAWFGAPFFISLFGAKGGVSMFAIEYLRIRAYALPAHMCFFVLTGALRGLQDFDSPLFASVLCNVANVALDAFFMVGLGMGVAGVAAATTIAQVTSCLVLGWVVVRKGCLRLEHIFKLPSKAARDGILRPGAVMVMNEVSESFVLTVTSAMATRLGPVEGAAMALARQLWGIVGVFWWPLAIVSQSMAASLFAAKSIEAMRTVVGRMGQIAFYAASMAGLLLVITMPILPGLFIKDEAVKRATQLILPIIALTLPFDAVVDVVGGALTGCKQYAYVARAMVIAATVSIAILFFLLHGLRVGLPGVWIALGFCSVTKLAFAVPRYFKISRSVEPEPAT
uniref:Multidrug and toxic compound extrusion protein n=1 Tax=Rhodosorus marinus TaxID=101924 RepID=A0A7S3EKU9_9RHOD|mmetsp:Transcript_44346/g.172469  ORF Transcript_44346/g.172469 Transcript_44346/m.172469 type:complete len:533 (+) Transcript_44346:175-1773(+)